MQITKRKFLPTAPDIVTVVAQVAAKRFQECRSGMAAPRDRRASCTVQSPATFVSGLQ
jgi:hypothetical protein